MAQVSLWGASSSTALSLEQVPSVGDSVVVGVMAYPVLEIAYDSDGSVYAKVGPGVPFGGKA